MYFRKIEIAIAITLALAVITLVVSPLLALVVLILGGSIILNRHLSRCRACQSWLTTLEVKKVKDDHNPGYGTQYEHRVCQGCDHVEYVRSTPFYQYKDFLRDQDPTPRGPYGF